MLEVNQKAPNFSAVNTNGDRMSLTTHRDKNIVVLYFYPKDDTSSCTIQANDFTKLKDSFLACNTVVYGISKDDNESHRNFTEKFNLTVDLLSDNDGSICDDYHTWGEKEKNGVKKMGLIRSTFIIDEFGIIRYAEYGVDAKDHANKILSLVKNFK